MTVARGRRRCDYLTVTPDVYRTPDDRFTGLPDFDFEPRYAQVDGLRLAYIDEGEGPPVMFFHGEPTWSFLWRRVILPVRDAGYRCIAPDYAGFGRSDKPTDIGWYTYDRHVSLMAGLVEQLDLNGATAVVHDWGGPIGLRLAVEHPERFGRMVIMETAPVTGHQQMSEDWLRFQAFVERVDDLPVGRLVRGGCFTDPGDEVIAAYDAPFPTPESKAGAKAFPAILPLTPDAPVPPPDRESPRRCRPTIGPASSSGRSRTRSCRSRWASGSPPPSGTTRPRLSPTPPTSSRRMPAPM